LFDYQKKGSFLLKPGEIRVNIGIPILYDEFEDLSIEELRQHTFDIINHLTH
jgi:hypothetical protein